ncbi:hypothetical protein [Rhodothermus profundi]|uniref:Uncharacterized protein n=1 Tax=Rhodothermus profundi TaxID=633813 RepID=A0A1M6PCM7_9BACT|nr:hypothetical protein [Rhodothermus profundi]SHK05620.1 hypothetical protein SAMN04488087_0126 [Rhodothermus profundi]
MAHRTVDDWLALLQPMLWQPVRQWQERINADPDLQQWLQEAAYRAAMEVASASAPDTLSAAYQGLQDELIVRFAELAEAVARLTQGCGRLRINWQPDAPHYSTVEIDFGRDYCIDLFIPLPDSSLDALQQALTHLRHQLPADPPYPRRPHQVTAILAYQGRCPALRLRDHLTPAGRQLTAIVLLPGQQPSAEMPPETALQYLHAYFLSGAPASC